MLVLGIGTALVDWLRRRSIRSLLTALNAPLLATVFVISCGVGALARDWHEVTRWSHGLAVWTSASVGALSAVLMNNLPAASLLAVHPAHPRSLLIGLNVGPNLAVTGSLSALLWHRICRRMGADVSVVRYSKIGILAVPPAIVGGVGALHILSSRSV